jgi:hypothetical protein
VAIATIDRHLRHHPDDSPEYQEAVRRIRREREVEEAQRPETAQDPEGGALTPPRVSGTLPP